MVLCRVAQCFPIAFLCDWPFVTAQETIIVETARQAKGATAGAGVGSWFSCESSVVCDLGLFSSFGYSDIY